MPLQSKPPRVIVCSVCGTAENRSPYGPAPTLCLACGDAVREEAHRQRMRDLRATKVRKFHSQRPLGTSKGTARFS